MIKTYDNENKININELSGSAYGNALELKIRENLNKFEQVIEVRKVWSLDSISDKVKTEKLKEINGRHSNNEAKNIVEIGWGSNVLRMILCIKDI